MNHPYHHGSGGYVGLGYPHPPNMPFEVSNNTNSNDHNSKVSRVFVGNLNPREVTDRMQLYHRFIKYGQITAISLHKGFAFIQFTSKAEAEHAVGEENGMPFGTQKLDLCISTERNKSGGGGGGGGGGGYKRYDSDFDHHGHQSAQAKKRRFQDNTLIDKKSGDEPTTWICSYCQHVSISAWELMKHAAAIHQTQIYDLNGAKPAE